VGATFRAQQAILDDIKHAAEEVEHHVHNYETSFGEAVSPSGETHVADRMADSPFQVTSGNDTWGAWVQVLGSEDTPFRAGSIKFDLSYIHVIDSNDATIFKIQVGLGASGAAALAADDITELYYKRGAANNTAFQTLLLDKRKDCGTKAWARVWAVGVNAKTLELMFGLHEYDE